MSWSVVFKSSQEGVKEDLSQAVIAAKQLNPTAFEDKWTGDQVEAATLAVGAIVASGAVGHSAIQVSISGHANPDHTPAIGVSKDYINVIIACIDPTPLS